MSRGDDLPASRPGAVGERQTPSTALRLDVTRSPRVTFTRRVALGGLLSSVATAATLDGGAPSPLRRVVVIGAHPDDPESGVGGTAARLALAGHAVTFVYLTRGEGGVAGKPAEAAGTLREAEARAACELLGVQPRFVGQRDGDTRVDQKARDAVSALLQQLAPELVFTHWPLDTHRDHRAAAELVVDDWVRHRRAYSLLFYETLAGHQTQTFSPDVFVDISSVVERKRDALLRHVSQAPLETWAHHERMQQFRGLETHAAAAEAFVHHRPSPPPELLLPFAPGR